MKLSRVGEFGLIERVRRSTPKGAGVRLGIGDDAAWVTHRSRASLVTADLLIEGIHFNLAWTSMFALGYKSLAVNLSDIAAMGGVPAYLLLSLGIPAKFNTKAVDEFYRGVRFLAAKTGVSLVGGDTSVADCLLVSACLIGHALYRPIRRTGAIAGNDIYVTGTLGDSALALELLKSGVSLAKRAPVAYLLSRHHKPTPRVRTGLFLAKERLATAMIDVSDGLLQDLGHICKASGVGAAIWEDRLPVSPAYRALCGENGSRYALTGGEDYELLFCARRRDRARIEQVQKSAKLAVTHIGECLPARQGLSILNRAGEKLSISGHGHDHFKSVAHPPNSEYDARREVIRS